MSTGTVLRTVRWRRRMTPWRRYAAYVYAGADGPALWMEFGITKERAESRARAWVTDRRWLTL